MTTSPSTDIIQGLAEELKGYIPLIDRNFEQLKKDPQQVDVLEEIHRLVHTIKGASSLVHIDGLSRIAQHLEDTLDRVMAGSLSLTPSVLDVMKQALPALKDYAEGMAEGGVTEPAMIEKTVDAFRNIQSSEAEVLSASDALLLQDDTSQESLDLLSDSTHARGESLDFVDNLESLSSDEADGVLTPEADEDPVASQKDELLEAFYQEADEHFQDLSQALATLESDITEETTISDPLREQIRIIRRSVHTIKGAAGIMGLTDVSAWAHDVEDVLDYLYETADTLSPDTVIMLVESSELLEQVVADPASVPSESTTALRRRFNESLGPYTVSEETPEPVPGDDPYPAMDAEHTDAPEPQQDTVEAFPSVNRPVKTLRVDTDRVDALVNLVGELIISFSAIDESMDTLMDMVSEFELSGHRLRDAVRNLEVGYEVKAIQKSGAHAISGAANTREPGTFEDFDILELDRYTEFNLIIRNLMETAVDIGAIQTGLSNFHSDLDGYRTRQRLLFSELQDKLMRVRMTPMSIISQRLRRTVRETAGQLGKKVRLVIEGEHTELDRMVWEKLSDPLMHLLRNAVDHGIEPSEQREAAGKPASGTVRISASYEGQQVVLRVVDDGAGIDYPSIREKVKHLQLTPRADRLSNDELADYIFYPGFSTRQAISEISGRGVGLDVVKEAILGLNGSVRIAPAESGHGTEFVIRLPLTVAVVRALMISIDNQSIAVPLGDVKEILRLSPGQCSEEPEPSVKIGHELLPLQYLTSMFDAEKIVPWKDPSTDTFTTLIVDNGEWRGAVVVDQLGGQKEIVVKNLGSHLGTVRGVAGATIMGDGTVVPIINVFEMFRDSTISVAKTPKEPKVADNPEVETSLLDILIVDDSVSIRQVVSRLMRQQGWQVRTSRDGIEALEEVHRRRPDVVILDIEMPRMNGYEFLGAFRRLPDGGNIPVIMLTSRTGEKHRQKAEKFGASGYMVKPYNDDEFIALIKRLTNGLN